ncbi:PAS domain S-box-containing protein [Halorientalis persicus]|uniref:histidine kinase n=1 Tax=Halorientalis persicus TaxID=1367881 RepID=A0A1H8PM09_9EURY|nr:histidine kinase N-terminal 7TM domain-containing protein [Halorientalis persicus]SEO42990.1 PAS domain S-box-containing protein [Halorientalis persicus]
MVWEFTPYTIPFAVTVLCSLVFGGYLLFDARRRGWDTGVGSLAVVSLGTLVWAGAALVQVSATSFSVMVVAEQWTYVGTPIVVIGWFVFTASYTDHDDLLSVPVVGSITLVLGVGTILALTNDIHQLMWATPTVVDHGSFSSLTYEKTVAYYLFVSVAFGVALLGVALLGRFMRTSPTLYRSQMAALIVAAAAPIVVSLWVVLGLGPHASVELSPIGFTFSVAAFIYAIKRYQLLDLEPIARTRVVESMREGYVVLGDDERIVDLNPSAQWLLEADETVIGADVRTVLPEIEPLLDGDDPTGLELSVEVAGERRYLAANRSALSKTGEGLGSLVLLRDVTERRQVEKRYQELIEHSTDVIAVLDEDWTVTYASPSHETVLGIDPDAIAGRRVAEYIHPDDRQQIRERFSSLVDEPGATVRFEFRIADADGEWRVLEGIARNLLENAVVRGVVINSRDITDRKRRERELERQNERLDDFANVVSHDLRNPLQIAEGYLDEARRTGDEDAFDRVETAHDRMETIIDDVLELARQGRTVGETEPVSLATVADEAWATVRTGPATLTVADDAAVEADPDRLRRLLENLFRNAVEHGSTGNQNSERSGDAVEHGSTSPPSQAQEDAVEHGGPDVSVTVGPLSAGSSGSDAGGTQRADGGTGFYVEDDGPGIPESDREAVFESGFTTETDGTGFGLTIVREIAEAHGWAVSLVDSEVGSTTAVTDGTATSTGGTERHGASAGTRFEFRPQAETTTDVS